MFASEMTDKSNVVGASDDDARLTFADDANVAVISDCLLRLGRCETADRWPRGVCRHDAATNDARFPGV